MGSKNSAQRSRAFLYITIFLWTFLLAACGGGGGGGDDDDDDTTAPTLTLLGSNPFNFEAAGSYSDPGATALDNVDGNITANIIVSGDNVDTFTVGVYSVLYNVSDAAGNAAAQLTRTVNVVDTTPPEITLIGPDPLNITIGGTFTDPGATALDSLDGDITANIVDVDDVNTAAVGNYVVTYNVSDAAGNEATQLSRVVNVNGVDTVAPSLTLLGPDTVKIVLNGTYTEPGFTAVDDNDGDISGSVLVTDNINSAVEGTYEVTYNVSDAAGNPAIQLTRIVIVDGTLPVITPLGANPLRLMVGDTYTDPGATAFDSFSDGDISSSIIDAGDIVNTAVEGIYFVTYDATDMAGNDATQVTRTVTVDSTPPVMNLVGDNPVKIMPGANYTEESATAIDNIDGDISGGVNIGGDTVNPAVEGTYNITYDSTDATGNVATQLTRAVIVDGTPPVITLLGDNPLEIAVGDTYIGPGATALDDVDGDITGDIIVGGDTVSTVAVASFDVTYDVSDAAGNAATQETRVVNVINTPPVINGFSISLNPVFVNSTATFNWVVDDANGDTLTCQVDVDNDGIDEYTINDCGDITTQPHTYTSAGDVTAKLTVSDGIAAPVTQTFNFSVVAPLSTDVSVNGPAVAGERVLYTITVGNTTAVPIDGVSVSFIVPAELSFHGSLDAQPNTTSGGCLSGCTPGATALWNIGTLLGGETRTISVNALANGSTLNNVTITLPVTFSGTAINATVINKDIEVLSSPSADLALSASTDPVIANETFTYRLDFGNTSAGLLTNTTLRAVLPSGVTFSSATDGGTETSVGSGIVVWNEGTVGVGDSLHREITVTADASLTGGQILKATIELTHDGGLAVDNTAEHAITVVSATLPLTVDVSTSAGSVVSPEHMLYTITVGNPSFVPVNNVSVQLRVPTELFFHGSFDAQPNTSGGCLSGCTAESEAFWDLGTLAIGETRTIMINALVATSVLNGNLIDAPIRVTADGMNDVIHLQKTLSVFSSPSADLALSASTDPVIANETFTYRLDFGNTSAGLLTNTTLRAVLPSGVTFSSATDGGTETSVGSGIVVWNEGTVGVGDSLHREITVTADASLTGGQILKATIELTHDGGLAVDNTAEHAITVVSATLPLTVDVSTSAGSVVSPEHMLYTITVGNPSFVPVNNVSVQLRVPTELFFHGSFDAQPNTSGGCLSGCTAESEAFWDLGTLAIGETRTIMINALVATSVLNGNLIDAPIRVTADGMNDVIHLQKTLSVFSSPSADLALSASTDPVIANETFTYRLDFGNTSAGLLTNTTLRAVLPSGVTFSSATDGGTETSVGSGIVVWNEGTVGVGDSLHREITVTADASLTGGQILKATIELTHDGGLAVDNTAEHAITVVSATLPLTVDVSTSAGSVVSPEHMLYTITVGNPSFVPVNNVSVQLRVPTELFFHGSFDAQPNTSGGCLSGCTAESEAFWDLGTLAIGETRTIMINALVATSVLNGNLIDAPIRVTADGMNDVIHLQKTLSVFSSPSADLALSASTDPVIANETFTYRLDFGNTSAGLLTNTTLRAVLPSGVTFSSATDGGTETSVGSGIVVWNEGTVGVGDSLHREITVVADGASRGNILTLYAELSHDGGLEVDNRSEFAVSVTDGGSIAALMSATITVVPDPVESNGIFDYIITVINGSAIPVNNVTVQLRVPTEASFHGSIDAQPDTTSGGCLSGCTAESEAFWNLGTIAAGATQIITIDADVAAALGDGTLIVSPFRVTATGMEDTIIQQHVTGISNP